jgi:hypothetical protein
MAVTLSNAAASAAADAVVDLLDAGSSNSHPELRIGITAMASIVATLEFTDATAFGAASNGVATANTITDDTNAAGGTAAAFQCVDQDGTVVFSGTVTATGGGGDIELSSVAIGATDTVSISSLTYTQPTS